MWKGARVLARSEGGMECVKVVMESWEVMSEGRGIGWCDQGGDESECVVCWMGIDLAAGCSNVV
jgi:hypothetical protein